MYNNPRPRAVSFCHYAAARAICHLCAFIGAALACRLLYIITSLWSN